MVKANNLSNSSEWAVLVSQISRLGKDGRVAPMGMKRGANDATFITIGYKQKRPFISEEHKTTANLQGFSESSQ